MTVGGILAAAWAAIIAVSLLCIAAFLVLSAGFIALTIARARRQAAGPSAALTDLARECDISDLEDIDDAFRRVLAEEHAKVSVWPSSSTHSRG